MYKKEYQRVALAVFAYLLSAGAASAESTGFSFMKMGVGAAPQAMGGAYTALAQDASSVYWNPSALPKLGSPELFAYHSRLVSDFSYSYFSYAKPFASRKAAFGLSYGRFSKGSFEGRDEAGNRSSDFSASDNLVTLSYGRQVTGKTSLGASMKFLQSKISEHSAAGFALDFAGSHQVSPRTSLAFGVFHAGPSLKYNNESVKLPGTATLGLAHKISILTLTSDFKYGLNDGKSALSLGGQFDVGSLASVRAGYVSQFARGGSQGSSKSLDQLSGVGMGMGLKLFSRTNLDYAFLPMGELGGTHHMSLSWRFK